MSDAVGPQAMPDRIESGKYAAIKTSSWGDAYGRSGVDYRWSSAGLRKGVLSVTLSHRRDGPRQAMWSVSPTGPGHLRTPPKALLEAIRKAWESAVSHLGKPFE